MSRLIENNITKLSGAAWISPSISPIAIGSPLTGDGTIGNPLTIQTGSFGDSIFFNGTSWIVGNPIPIGGTDPNIFLGGGGNPTVTGENNVAIGPGAGANLGDIYGNVLIGVRAGEQLVTSGGGNTFLGHEAGSSMTGSQMSTMVGNRAGLGIADGDNNIGLGANVFFSMSSGTDNIAIGNFAGPTNDGVNRTVTLGAGFHGPIGNGCIMIGADARVAGADLTTNAIAIGDQATSRQDSIAFGASSNAGTGSICFGFGANAVQGNSIAFGYGAACNASGSIAIGHNASTSTFTGSIALGNGAVATNHQQLVLAGPVFTAAIAPAINQTIPINIGGVIKYLLISDTA